MLLTLVTIAALLHSGIAAFSLLLLLPVAVAAFYLLRHTRTGNHNRTPS